MTLAGDGGGSFFFFIVLHAADDDDDYWLVGAETERQEMIKTTVIWMCFVGIGFAWRIHLLLPLGKTKKWLARWLRLRMRWWQKKYQKILLLLLVFICNLKYFECPVLLCMDVCATIARRDELQAMRQTASGQGKTIEHSVLQGANQQFHA